MLNKRNSVSLFLLSFLLASFSKTATSSCQPKDKDKPSCQCKTEKGYTVDLEDIFDDVKGSEPLFSVTAGDYDYTFQPCRPFSCDTTPGVAVCQQPKSKPYYVAGYQTKANFSGSIYNDDLVLHYEGQPDDVTKAVRKTNIHLKCDKKETKFTGTGEEKAGSLVYEFTLNTKRVCPPKGLSTGSILVIVFFVLLAVYFVGGMLFLRFVRGARGEEMIPNLEFWKELPGLAKDGFLFVSRGCKTDPTYNQI